MGKGTSDLILVVSWITMRTVQSEIEPLLNKIWADFNESFSIALQWHRVKETIDYTYELIWITMLTLHVKIPGNAGISTFWLNYGYETSR